MKELQRKGLAVILLLSMAISVTGCSFGFDAGNYVKSCLDACTKGEVTEYAKITNTSEEDALKTYNDFIDADVAAMSIPGMTEDQKSKYRQLFIDIYASMDYEIGEVTKNSDGSYTVPVNTKKLMIFEGVVDSSQKYMEDWAKQNSSASIDDLYRVLLDYMYDEISNNLKAKKYEDNAVFNVQVTKAGDNVYSISDMDLKNLLTSMMDIENAS